MQRNNRPTRFSSTNELGQFDVRQWNKDKMTKLLQFQTGRKSRTLYLHIFNEKKERYYLFSKST